jgi:hypothetical protein
VASDRLGLNQRAGGGLTQDFLSTGLA